MIIKTIFNNKIQRINIEKITLFYGPNNCGKTKLLQTFNDGFSGKLKKDFLVNHLEVDKTQYDVVYIDDKSDINDHLKLTNKSLIKAFIKDYYEDEKIKQLLNIIDCNLKNGLQEFNNFINSNINTNIESEINIALTIKETEINELIDSLVCLTFNNNPSLSSSGLRRELITYFAMQKGVKDKIIIIDNFDNEFDLNHTLDFIMKITTSNDNIFFILSTNKSISFKYIYLNHINYYFIQSDSLLNFNNLNEIIRICLAIHQNNHDDLNYLYTDDEIEKIIKNQFVLLLDSIGIMITNNNYTISEVINNSWQVNISYKNETEELLLKYLLEATKSFNRN